MNVEPLQSILKVYKDKNKVFMDYLDQETIRKLKNHIFFEEKEQDLYLNDMISFVTKNTGKLFKKGKIIAIDENKITIKSSSYYLTLDKNEYYIFIRQRKNKNNKNDRDFYKALFNSL